LLARLTSPGPFGFLRDTMAQMGPGLGAAGPGPGGQTSSGGSSVSGDPWLGGLEPVARLFFHWLDGTRER